MTTELPGVRAAVLVEDLPSTSERVRAELEAFADSLDAIAKAAGD